MSNRVACLGAGLLLLFFCTGCPQAGSELLGSSGTDGAASAAGRSGVSGSSAAPSAAAGSEQQTTTFAPTAPASCAAPIDEVDWEQQVLDLVNQVRGRSGLPLVSWNDTLATMASGYACELIQYDYFDHVNPVTGESLGDRARASGYNFSVVGENLAAGQQDPVQAFEDWMASPSHRENILDPRFRELGVGIRVGGDYGVYWVQEFGVQSDQP